MDLPGGGGRRMAQPHLFSGYTWSFLDLDRRSPERITQEIPLSGADDPRQAEAMNSSAGLTGPPRQLPVDRTREPQARHHRAGVTGGLGHGWQAVTKQSSLLAYPLNVLSTAPGKTLNQSDSSCAEI